LIGQIHSWELGKDNGAFSCVEMKKGPLGGGVGGGGDWCGALARIVTLPLRAEGVGLKNGHGKTQVF